MCKQGEKGCFDSKSLEPDIFYRMVVLKQNSSEIEKELVCSHISEDRRKEIKSFMQAINEWKELRDDRRGC
nr:hypothetical protein [Clostridia bacterium]